LPTNKTDQNLSGKLIGEEDEQGIGLISFNKLLPTLGMNSRDCLTGKISLGLLMFRASVGATL